MARVIWSRPGNPTRAVARRLGIARAQLGDAIHAIKEALGLLPSDDVKVWDDGTVTDDHDVWLGNIYDEI
jgi:hypothetical protein